jgi:hypothetical protein
MNLLYNKHDRRRNLKNVLSIVLVTNFFLVTYELQLWSNFLSPLTKLITIFILSIFGITTFKYIKHIKKTFKYYKKNKLIWLYIIFILYVILLGPAVLEGRSFLYEYFIFLIYHYVAIMSIVVLDLYKIKTTMNIFNDLIIKYIAVIAILTIMIYLSIGSGLIDITNYKIDYKEYFNASPPTRYQDYYFPFFISIFRADEVTTLFNFDFYRSFSFSSEPGKAALYASIALIFSYRQKPVFLLILIYYLMLSSMLSFLALFFIIFITLFRKYKKIILTMTLFFMLSLLFIIINLFISEEAIDFSLIGPFSSHANNTFLATEVYLNLLEPSLFGTGYTSISYLIPLQVINKFGYIGGSIFILFYVSLFFHALKFFLNHKGASYHSLFSLFIVFILIQMVKQGFIYNYYFIFYILVYLYYMSKLEYIDEEAIKNENTTN